MPEDLESRAQLATLYTRQNKHDEAIDVWKALLEIDPENTKYQDGLVDTYRDAGETTEAFELTQQYIERDPESSVHYARLAKLYAAEDNVDDAISTYKKAIELGHMAMDRYTFNWHGCISRKIILMLPKKRLRMPFNTLVRSGNGRILRGNSWHSIVVKGN